MLWAEDNGHVIGGVVSDVRTGLEGVVAVETEIAEPDRDGGALRYRGVDLEDIAGQLPFELVWGLLVDGSTEPGLAAPGEPLELVGATGDPVADLQASTARLAGTWHLAKLIDATTAQVREDLRRVSAAMLSLTAQAARRADGHTDALGAADAAGAAERFLLEWRGEADPRHVVALDTYWVCTAEHGLNASTFTARIAASTGADCAAAMSAAVGALSGPLHGGAPARVLPMLDEAAGATSIGAHVGELLDAGERLMGFGHRVYRAEDPRARVLRRTAREIGAPRYETAVAFEAEALAQLARRKPDRVLATNVEFWSAVVLDTAGVPPALAPALFACSRSAGWSAHILEQHATGRLIRPSARYVGPGARSLETVIHATIV